MTDIDTADIIRYQGEEFTVACAHITHVYVMGLAPNCFRREKGALNHVLDISSFTVLTP